jgi:hypothetical protein
VAEEHRVQPKAQAGGDGVMEGALSVTAAVSYSVLWPLRIYETLFESLSALKTKCTRNMKIYFRPHRKQSLPQLERPVTECCVGEQWLLTVRNMCIGNA